MTPSIDQTLHLFANLLPNWTLIPILTLLPNFGGFHRTLQRVRLAIRGRLLLRTPGPVPFGTCICSNVETILSWTCHVYGPFEFRTSLGTSILLYRGGSNILVRGGVYELLEGVNQNLEKGHFFILPININVKASKNRKYIIYSCCERSEASQNKIWYIYVYIWNQTHSCQYKARSIWYSGGGLIFFFFFCWKKILALILTKKIILLNGTVKIIICLQQRNQNLTYRQNPKFSSDSPRSAENNYQFILNASASC